MQNKKQETIAIIFDFDDTLGKESTSGFLKENNIDVNKFWENAEKRQKDHWDPVLAYIYEMIELSKNKDNFITYDSLASWGKKTPLYRGVKKIFAELKKRIKEIDKEINLEFYIISSGIEIIIRHTPIAKYFTDIWGCNFIFDDKGSIAFPKRVVSYTDKTRYIFQVKKGIIGNESRKDPFLVNKKFSKDEIKIPIEHMIFVGDGFTDIPCFSLVEKEGGIALAICDTKDRSKWGKAWGFLEENRITHWAAADYSSGSTLYTSLMMAIESIAKKITLKRRSYHS